MLPRWIRPISWTTVAMVAGCGWVNTRSNFERDPFVMSHLTHQKNDPLYAGSDSDHAFDDDKPLQAASVSRKEPRSDYRQMSYQNEPSQLSRASDFSWIEGRLVHRAGPESGWYVRYVDESNSGRNDAEIRLVDSPRLGLARAGDRVRLEGQVVDSDIGSPRYEVDSIVVLGP